MCLTGDDGEGPTVRRLADSLLFYNATPATRRYRAAVTVTVTMTVTAAATATTTHALRTITSHTVRWTINVTSHHWQQQKQNIRTEAIVRTDTDDCACARARPRVCVFRCVCMCVFGCVCVSVVMCVCVRRQVATITVKRSGSLGFRRMTPTGYERRGARLPVDGPLFGVRARPNSNEPRAAAQTLRTLQTLLTTLPETIPTGPRGVWPSSAALTRWSKFIIRVARFSPGKMLKTEDPESKTFRNGRGTPPNTLGFESV